MTYLDVDHDPVDRVHEDIRAIIMGPANADVRAADLKEKDDPGIDHGTAQIIRPGISVKSRDSDVARLAEVLTGIVSSSSRRNNNHFLNDKFLPEFDPVTKDLSASNWIEKINDCGLVYDWDDKVKPYLSG